MKQLPIVVNVSKKVLDKVSTLDDPLKEMSIALDAWVDSNSVESESVSLKGKYIHCSRHNQRIEAVVCISRVSKKQRGCGSCPKGKALTKIDNLLKEL